MANQEIIDTEIQGILGSLLRGNYIDKISHLNCRGYAENAKHVLLQERYELYQDSFDELAEFMLGKYWTKIGPVSFPVTFEGDPYEESKKVTGQVLSQLEAFKSFYSEDSALISLLDDIEIKLRSVTLRLDG